MLVQQNEQALSVLNSNIATPIDDLLKVGIAGFIAHRRILPRRWKPLRLQLMLMKTDIYSRVRLCLSRVFLLL